MYIPDSVAGWFIDTMVAVGAGLWIGENYLKI